MLGDQMPLFTRPPPGLLPDGSETGPLAITGLHLSPRSRLSEYPSLQPWLSPRTPSNDQKGCFSFETLIPQNKAEEKPKQETSIPALRQTAC